MKALGSKLNVALGLRLLLEAAEQVEGYTRPGRGIARARQMEAVSEAAGWIRSLPKVVTSEALLGAATRSQTCVDRTRCPEAIALREAAIAFAECLKEEPGDSEDLKGQKLNRKLLTAAVAYAKVVS